MFERFTDRARRVLVLAQEEARILGHPFIGTEHILLGLIHEGDGIAAQALESGGISLEAVRTKVEEVIGPATEPKNGSPPFTPRTKKVLELSHREALQLGHNYISTEHILLGLVREGEGVAAQVLMSLGADLPSLREAVFSRIGGYEETQPRESSGEGSFSRLIGVVDWPSHPRKVIAGPVETLTSQGITFRVVGVSLHDEGIEVMWRLSDVPAVLIELLEDSTMAPADDYDKPRITRLRPIGRPNQRRVFSGSGSGILTTFPRFRRGAVGNQGGSFLRISVDDDPHYTSAIGEYEPQGGGELAGRSYFVPETVDEERPPVGAKTLRVEWQGQSIKVDL